jgi:hypothetical protein
VRGFRNRFVAVIVVVTCFGKETETFRYSPNTGMMTAEKIVFRIDVKLTSVLFVDVVKVRLTFSVVITIVVVVTPLAVVAAVLVVVVTTVRVGITTDAVVAVVVIATIVSIVTVVGIVVVVVATV